jgi:hypothetical protein
MKDKKNNIKKTPLTFVTAIYDYNIDSIYGGRGRGVEFYKTTLKNVSNLKIPIVIYTDEKSLERVDFYVSKYFKNYKIIPYELSDFKFTKKILAHKKKIFKNIELNDRNHVLCYHKPYWVKDAIEKNFYNSERFLWIDSGLFHHGIIPEKFGGVELYRSDIPDSFYYPKNKNNIFTPKFGKKLIKNIKPKKIFGCGLGLQGCYKHLCDIAKKVFDKDITTMNTHVIGGIFGGYKDDFLSFFDLYDKTLEYCVNNNILLLEEPIFTCINATYPEIFDLKMFDIWWFYMPGEPCNMLSEEADSFYKIFLNL